MTSLPPSARQPEPGLRAASISEARAGVAPDERDAQVAVVAAETAPDVRSGCDTAASARPAVAGSRGTKAASRFSLSFSRKDSRYAAGLLAVFVLSLLSRLWFNFLAPHVNNFAACDAFEYISKGKALLELAAAPPSLWLDFVSCAFGTASSGTCDEVRKALAPLKDFGISGPAFPAFVAMSLLVSGSAQSPIYLCWDKLVLAQSLLSSAQAVLTAMIASRCFGRRTGIAAGLLAAFYPGFIVNSGRLYSETFASFLLALLVWLALRSARPGGAALLETLVTGACACWLQLTRSVMVVVSAASLVVALVRTGGRRRWAVLAAFAAGFALVVLPWLGLQKVLFGGGGVVVDRVGQYNFFIGNNTDIGGWLSYPYPDGRGVEKRSYVDLFTEAVRKSPERWLKLCVLDKPARLFKHPWNDFRTPVGPFGYSGQVAYHQVLLVLAAIGAALSWFVGRRRPGRAQLAARCLVASLVLFHLIYCLFITVPRYNLTAMTGLIVFSASGLAALGRMLASRGERPLAVTLIFGWVLLALVESFDLVSYLLYLPFITPKPALVAACALRSVAFVLAAVVTLAALRWCRGYVGAARAVIVVGALALLPLFVLPARANGRWYEWCVELAVADSPVRQRLRIPLVDLTRYAGRDLFLLVDSDRVLQPAHGLSLRVNGKRLAGPVIPGLSLVERFDRLLDCGDGSWQREGERMWDSLAAAAAIGNSDIRQWSLIAIPPEAVLEAIKRANRGSGAGSPASEQGAEGGFAEFEVELSNLSDDPVRIFGGYQQGTRERLVPSVSLYSWEKAFYGVENPHSLSDPRYDLRVPSTGAVPQTDDLSTEPGRQTGTYNLGLLVAPPPFPDGSARKLSVPIHDCLLSQARNDNSQILLRTPEPLSDQSMWLVTVRGKVRARGGQVAGRVNVLARYDGSAGQTAVYNSPWVPRRIACRQEWTDFEFAVPVQPGSDAGSVTRLLVGLSPAVPSPDCLNVPARQEPGVVEFANVMVDLTELSANPLGLGHRVY